MTTSAPNCWPPSISLPTDRGRLRPMPVPWLDTPPEVVSIDGGRQLLVDDYLIAETTMVRLFGRPTPYAANPVFWPQTAWERHDALPPCTLSKCGGVWWDQAVGRFRMWYMASYLGVMCHAQSDDGIHWERPVNDVVPGTNLILPEDVHPDSGTVWIDEQARDGERYKFMMREPDPAPGTVCADQRQPGARMFVSGDGLHWRELGSTGPMGDRSTMFYNPWRRKWVFSVRGYQHPFGRLRRYWEQDAFGPAASWKELNEPPFWVGADELDEPGDSPAQLYTLDATPYESLLLGLFQIHKGPPNLVGERLGVPKLTELVTAYSRDGFHWHRPDRRAFIGADREPGAWNRGYIEAGGGVCIIVGDELWIYYNAYAGDPTRIKDDWRTSGTYANGQVALAKLRRDGFAALRARTPEAMLLTRPVRFTGDRLFVNANTAGCTLKAEVRRLDGSIVEGLSSADCRGFTGNATAAEIQWKSASLAQVAGQPVRLRFTMDRGDLYAFWVTTDPGGASGGYTAAGVAGT